MTDPKRARCFDKDWRYVPSNETDISKTFARLKRQQKEAEAAREKQPKNIAPIKRRA